MSISSTFYACIFRTKFLTKPECNKKKLPKRHLYEKFVRKNVDEIDTFRQFHQRFFMRFFRTNVILAAFSSYVPALSKILYEKCARNTLTKLTPSSRWLVVHCGFVPYLIFYYSTFTTFYGTFSKIIFYLFEKVTKFSNGGTFFLQPFQIECNA